MWFWCPRFFRSSPMALFHCMIRHGTVQYGWLLGVFHWVQYLVPGTFFSTTSAEVPSDPYRYQNVTCKLCWSLIGWRESSLLRHWTCDMRPNIDPLDLISTASEGSDAPFCINQKIFVSLSVTLWCSVTVYYGTRENSCFAVTMWQLM